MNSFVEMVVIPSLAIIAALIAVVYPLEYYGCMAQYDEFSPSYSFMGGCKVVVDGKRVPADTLRVVK